MFFKVLKKSKKSKARLGLVKTKHGVIHTPAFFPVATKATVKSLTPEDVKEIGFETGNKKNVILSVKDAHRIGQKAGERIIIKNKESKSIEDKYWYAILQIDYSNSLVRPGEIGVFIDLLKKHKNLSNESIVSIKPAEPPDSFTFIKRKIKGEKLYADEINNIIDDAVSGSLSRIDLAAFITAVSINGMDNEEITSFTLAEARSGEMFDFGPEVFDKHST